MNKAVYLDYNATTPVHPEVLKAMLPFFTEEFGNAASKTHVFGITAEKAVEQSRETIAKQLKCTPQEIIFTSGATEAINLGIKGIFESYSTKGNEIVTVATEHKAVLDTCRYLETKGAKVSYLPVNVEGSLDLEQLRKSITDKTVLVAIMTANNETGVIQDMKAISGIVHERGSIVLSDTTQAWGKIPVDIQDLGIDVCCMSAHKIYGPKGVGILYARRKDPRVTLSALIHGGGHEKGWRSGTLNVPGIVGLGKAVEMIPEFLKGYSEVQKLREELEQKLMETGNVKIHGKNVARLPNTSNFSIKGFKAKDLIRKLPLYAFSTGSACTSANPEPSHVLKAMGISDDEAQCSIRISMGISTDRSEIGGILKEIPGY